MNRAYKPASMANGKSIDVANSIVMQKNFFGFIPKPMSLAKSSSKAF